MGTSRSGLNPTHWAGPLVLLGALLSVPLRAESQWTDDPIFRVYGMEDGLSQGSANALLQDHTGFIWIGTQDGLNRFDGVSFKPFKNIRDDTTSLSDDYIRSLALNLDGRIWVGTERGGLNLFDPRTGRSERYPLEELGPWQASTGPSGEGHAGRTVQAMALLEDRTLLLSTDAGLAQFLPSTGQVFAISPPQQGLPDLPPPQQGLPSPPPPVICGLEEEGVLAGYSDGSVWLVRPGMGMEELFRLTSRVDAIRCPRAGNGFVAVRSGDIFALSGDAREIEHLGRIEFGPEDQNQVTDVIRMANGTLWIATNRGLFVMSDGQDIRRIDPRDDDRGLPNIEITGFMVDMTGMLWIGTWNGIANVHPLSRVIRRIPLRSGGKPGFSGNGVIAITGDGEDGLLVGTMDGGVERIDAGWREGPASITRLPSLSSLNEGRIYRFAFDPSGNLWIAALDRSAMVLDAGRTRLRTVPLIDLDGRRVPGFRAYSVFVDDSGAVWAGTREAGLARYNPITGVLEEFKGPTGEWDYGSDWVWPIREDGSRRLWVGAFDGGVIGIDPDRRTRQFYDARPGQLSDNRILTLFSGSRGLVWIGTQGGGMNRLDPETGEIRVYTAETGLPHDHVEGIIEDDRGFLWITTNDGIARFDPETEEFWVLREAAGLAGNRFFANAVYKNERGELFLGGDAGLTILDPARIRPVRRPPEVALTGFQIHGQDRPLARALEAEVLELGPNENFFSFQFAALDFTDPTLNRYRYILEGVDQDWVDSGTERMARYTSVPPGLYTFRVAARSADGAWNDQGISIPIRVRKPYYLTWWFRSLAAALLVLLATWAIYRRTSEHRRRLDVAGRLHDGIGANIASILRAAEGVEAGLSPDHPGRRELDRVKTLAQRAQTEMRAAVRILRRGKETETLASLVRELNDTADFMLHGNIRYEVTAPDQLPHRMIHWKARPDVSLLFNEVLNNVLKHAGATFVKVDLGYEPPYLVIRVEDDGRGFDQDGGSGGHGLGLMQEHANRHHGEVTIQSRPESGTIVEARLKVH